MIIVIAAAFYAVRKRERLGFKKAKKIRAALEKLSIMLARISIIKRRLFRDVLGVLCKQCKEC